MSRPPRHFQLVTLPRRTQLHPAIVEAGHWRARPRTIVTLTESLPFVESLTQPGHGYLRLPGQGEHPAIVVWTPPVAP